MILIAGGTGRLGRILVERLSGGGEPLRVLSRDPDRAALGGTPTTVEFVRGDVQDPEAVARAMAGIRVVVSALSAFGMQGVAPRAVDFGGNVNLIAAAEKAGVTRFVFVSVLGASAEHPMELARMKHLAEERLRRSSMSWTILRPSTFIETFQHIICAPLLSNGKAMVFGRGQNPINFVSAYDAARFVELAITQPRFDQRTIDIGGPDNVSLVQFVEAFRSALGLGGSVKHIPRFALRALSQLARPFNPTFARMARAGVLMDTTNMSFDASALMAGYPEISFVRVADAARRDYASREPSLPSH